MYIMIYLIHPLQGAKLYSKCHCIAYNKHASIAQKHGREWQSMWDSEESGSITEWIECLNGFNEELERCCVMWYLYTFKHKEQQNGMTKLYGAH